MSYPRTFKTIGDMILQVPLTKLYLTKQEAKDSPHAISYWYEEKDQIILHKLKK